MESDALDTPNAVGATAATASRSRTAARGATAGMSQALNNAVLKRRAALAAWVLENGQPDLAWTDYQSKTALQNARESGQNEIAEMIERT